MSLTLLQTYSAQQDVFIARQAIFGRDLEVYGYELLFRASSKNEFDGTAADLAASRVIANAFVTIGAEKLLHGKPAFINFGESMFTPHLPILLPSRSTVIEILESVRPTDRVIGTCRELKRLGYTLALDDVSEQSNLEPWLPVIGILKVDFLKTGPEKRRLLAEHHRCGPIKLLAEKLESRAHFESAVALGYDYFQGFFFARPEIVSAAPHRTSPGATI